MTTGDQAETLAQLKRSLVALKDLRGRLDSVERARTEPIAIIGMACRVPGADSPQAFWDVLAGGTDAITETPSERWDTAALYSADTEAAGKIATRWGGFLQGIDQFDAAFFGISPREATAMDPQQRLLLEVAWEALEDAGQTTGTLAGSKTGVFVGVHSHSSDYYLMQAADSAALDTYSGTGTSHSVLAGRISYLFDLQGPSVALDTACSSSLVAVHQAVTSLRNRESAMALAGGVNVMLEPSFTIAASRMRMLAADGRCKTFDAAADGFVRAEGCGVVILKRLSDAQADGDRVLGVIYGSAVNQDGHSNGLTAPNSLSQQDVVRAALANGGVAPQSVGYLEAHGTGTALGDPIEIEALATVFGKREPANGACVLGSAKANIGHTEGAAGVVGLIKAVLSLRNQAIPPLAHFKQLNPHISLAATPFVIPTALQPWPAGAAPRYAGVSSFGWSGTNAHVVVGDPPQPTAASGSPELGQQPLLLPVSARSPEALKALAQSYVELLARNVALNTRDFCRSAATRRSHHEYRLVVVGNDRTSLAEQLAAFAAGQQRPNMHSSRVERQTAGVVFVFPGQGAQWLGMARGLLATEPAFRTALEQCDAAIQLETSFSVLEQLAAETNQLDQIDVIQPVLFAIQIGLAALWRARGVVPDAVVGHSMGEVAAAHVAGILNLEAAVRVICLRSRLMRQTSGQGAMAVVELSPDDARQAIRDYADRLAVAVNNSPSSTVLSGDPAALAAVLDQLKAREIFCRYVKVDVASHSPQMERLCAPLRAGLADLQPQPATIPFYSTVTGAVEDGTGCNADYWARNLRQPVRFADTTRKLLDDGNTLFVELSPHPLLLSAIETTASQTGYSAITIASLGRNADEPAAMLGALGALYAAGYPVDWRLLYPQGAFVPLPSYPWQHERFWLRDGHQPAQTSRRSAPEHQLLGWRVALAGSEATAWEQELRQTTHPELYENRVDGAPVLPAATYRELAAAAAHATGSEHTTIIDVVVHTSLPLDDQASTVVQTVLKPESNQHILQVYSRSGNHWTLHASATLRAGAAESALVEEQQNRLPIDQWMYTPGWKASSWPDAVATRAGERWLILADTSGVATTLAERLHDAGAVCVLAFPGDRFAPLDDTRWTIRLENASDMRALLDGVFAPAACTGIVSLCSLDAPTNAQLTADGLEQAQDLVCGSVLHLLQALAASKTASPRLWVATRGAQPVQQGDEPALAQAPVWGLGRVAAEEHTELWGGLIDLDPQANPAESAVMLERAIGLRDNENQQAIRAGQRLLARLARPACAKSTPIRWRADSSYLITGAFGGVGAAVARWAVAKGARRLVLAGRTPLPARGEWAGLAPESPQGRRIALVRELEAQGASVHIAALDVGDEAQLGAFLTHYQAEGWPPIRGVIHAAVAIEDRLLSELDLAALHAALPAKLRGGLLLDQMLGELDFFVLFSSLGAVLGQVGQANYAAANSFLDALAFGRRARGLPALSINWGAWADLGLAALAGTQQTIRLLEQSGIGSFDTASGLAALDLLMNQAIMPQVIVAPIDWHALAARGQVSPILADLVAAEANRITNDIEAVPQMSQRAILIDAAPEERRALLEALVVRHAAHVLKLAPERIERGRPFGALGFDSLTSVELRNRLGTELELPLSATIVWNYPTVADLAAYLAERIAPTEVAAVVASAAFEAEPALVATGIGQAIEAVEELSDEEAMRLLLGGA